MMAIPIFQTFLAHVSFLELVMRALANGIVYHLLGAVFRAAGPVGSVVLGAIVLVVVYHLWQRRPSY
jgi:hypothetical protein